MQVLEGFVDEEKKGCGFVRDLVSGLSMGVREREGEGGEKEDEDKLMFPGFACFLEKNEDNDEQCKSLLVSWKKHTWF